jgi:hypothetical protein
MAIPSGSVTEVLKRNSIPSQTTGWTEIDWTAAQTAAANTSNATVPTNHIITILNISFNNQSGAARTFDMRVINSSHAAINIIESQSLPISATFVWNDRLILHPADRLSIRASGTALSIWLNYIQQDWT